MQGAFCRAPNGGRRAGLSHRRWRARCEGSHAWTRPLALHPLLQESDGPRPRVGVGSPKHLRVGKAKRARVGKKAPSPTRRKKRRRRSPRDASRQIYFIAWVACAREMMAPTFLVAVDQGGIDFLAASGFNDVSSTGILTYS